MQIFKWYIDVAFLSNKNETKKYLLSECAELKETLPENEVEHAMFSLF